MLNVISLWASDDKQRFIAFVSLVRISAGSQLRNTSFNPQQISFIGSAP
jgi:hypothetical protein